MRAYAPDLESDELTLSREEARHLVRVRRARVGDEVSVLDGRGGEVLCELLDREGRLRVFLRRKHRRTGPAVHLVQALPKGQKLDWIVQKAAELGVVGIHPVVTARCEAKAVAGRAGRTERGRQILLEGMKQCGNPWLPELGPPRTLAEFLAAPPAVRRWLAAVPAGSTVPLGELEPAESTGIFIGPEGDFTAEEVEALEGFGAVKVGLGPYVLRSETAAVLAVGLLRYGGRG